MPWILVLSLLLTPLAWGEDLLDIYRLAKERDAVLQQAEAAYRAALQAKPQARAGLLPVIDLSAEASRNRQDIEETSIPSRLGVSYFDSHGYTLSLAQPIFRKKAFIALRQADATIQQAFAQLEAARQELMVRTASRYFDVLAAQDDLDFARAEKAAIARQLEQARQRFEVGLIAITDVQESKARYDLSVAQEIAAENQLDNAKEALREVTGSYAKALAVLKEAIPLASPEPADIQPWTDRALAQNPALLAARQGVELARENIRLSRADHLPTLDLVASHGLSDRGGGVFSSRTKDSSISLQFKLNLFQGGAIQSRIREAREKFDESRSALEEARRSTQRQVREAYLAVMSGISRVKALKQALVSTQTALEATEAGFEVGTRTAVDVLDAQRELYGARRDYAKARYDYLLATLRLKQAAGILEASDIAAVNRFLVPHSSQEAPAKK